jgi:hypothetical protein
MDAFHDFIEGLIAISVGGMALDDVAHLSVFK